MDKLSELTVSAIKGWEKLVIFSGLCIFSLYIAGMVYYFIVIGSISVFNLNLLIFFSFIIFVLSYIAYRYFPGKFPHWNIKLLWKILKKSLRKKGTKSDASLIAFIILFFFPFAVFLKSIGLAFFVLSLINSETASLWEQVLLNSEKIYSFLGGMLVPPLLGLLVGILLPMIIVKKIDEIYGKNIFTQILLFIWLLIFSVIIINYLSLEKSILAENLMEKLLVFSAFFIKLVIGFLPLGLFYELFIGSILGKEEDIKFLKLK